MTRLTGILVPERFAPEHCGTAVGDLVHVDLTLKQGVVGGFAPPTASPRAVALPPLADAHVHLDKCHTIGRMPDVGGDLSAALAAQRADRPGWTEADIRSRAARGLEALTQGGARAARTHVDWDTDDAGGAPLAWDVLAELAEEHADVLTLQRAALTGAEQLEDEAFALGVARRMARESGVLGCFVLDHGAAEAALRNAFALAERFGLMLDFHADEGLDPKLSNVERIADIALEAGHQGPVLIGHACALSALPWSDAKRIAEKLARAGISVASLPSTNLYLQGRRNGTPKTRGLTLVHELIAAGVCVTFGADNVQDAFCPLGRFDPLHTLSLASVAAHLDPPFARWLPMVSTDAHLAMGLPAPQIIGSKPLLFEALTIADLLSGAHQLKEVADVPETT